MSDYETLAAEARHNAAIEAQEFALIATLRPRIFIDGDRWCVLYGDDVQEGVAGFGGTAREAVYAFNNAWDQRLTAPAAPQVADVTKIPRAVPDNARVPDDYRNQAIGWRAGWNDYRTALLARMTTNPAPASEGVGRG